MVDGNTPTNTILVEGAGVQSINGTYNLSSGQPGKLGATYVRNSSSLADARIIFTNLYIEIYQPPIEIVGKPRVSYYKNYTLNISSGWELSTYGGLPVPTVKYI